MEANISEAGILEVRALVMSEKVFGQIVKKSRNPAGKLIGYVVDDVQMVTFIGIEDGKLFRTRQDFMVDTWVARNITTDMEVYRRFPELLKAEMSILPQIFLK